VQVAKSKTRSARKSTAKKSSETAEFVVTLDLPQRKIAKIESVDGSGKRHTLSDLEFARLIAGDEEEDIVAALEEAYDAGIADGIEEALFIEPAERGGSAHHPERESMSGRVAGAEERPPPPRRSASKRGHAGGNGTHGKH
jgi:hypothetical protein